MKFYGRSAELVQLQHLSQRAYAGHGTMTLMVGRRRVGKTYLIKECYQDDPNFLYFFVARKSQELLCEEYLKIISTKFTIPNWSVINSFLGLFEFILQQACATPLTVVFDEFQDFQYVDPAIFSGMQNLWDSYKHKSKIHIIACGSLYSIMCKIFENSKEPLFGRADTKIHLKPLKITDLKQILMDENQYSAENILTLYAIVGGIPRYLELLQVEHAWDLNAILPAMLNENSFFVNEGKDVLIEELGKDYRTYFSILSLISTGKTSRPAIESVLQTTTGGYIERLEQDFNIIERHRPMFAEENSRNIKYFIKDNFLNFWFRYFNKNQSAAEIGNFTYIINLIKEDFLTYSGRYLEQMVRELLAASGEYNIIGSYWEKDGSNEIDIIACNDHKKIMLIADVKLQSKKLNLDKLKYKAEKIIAKHSDYQIQFAGFSLENIAELLR